MTFGGFDRGALALLPALPSLDAQAYAERRDALALGLVKPAASLIQWVAMALGVPLTVSPRHSVSPLHTDLRFARPGAPRYKDHLLLTTWHGPDKKTGPTLWIRIDAKSVGFASSASFTANVRERWRAAVAGSRGATLSGTVDELARHHVAHEFEVAGDLLKKVPAPWTEDHPRAAFLRRTGFQVRFRIAMPAEVHEPTFAPWCADRLRHLLPVHRWLVDEIYDGSEER